MKTNETKPIICGTDFSENAHVAATAAAALAGKLGAPLRLLHASAIPHHPDTQESLRVAAQRLHEAGAEVTAETIGGDADEVLADAARKHRARFLVVSSLGKRGLDRWLIGSVAERTAEISPVPTLVVRNAAPFQEWARGERALRVFVGVDFTISADAALEWVAELRRIGPVEVVAGYVDWPAEEGTRLGVASPVALFSNPPEMQRVLERDVREKVARVLGDESVEVRVHGNWGRPEFPLVKMADDARADLIVVGAHRWRGIEGLWHSSVSRGVLRHAPMSVACVPAPTAAPMTGPRVRECRRVLVAVDINEAHGFAAPHGYSIVQPGGTVRLLHNVVPFRLPNPMIGGSFQDYPTKKEHAQLVAEAEQKLRALAPHAAEARGIETEVEVTESRETAGAICAAAERFGADVICVGSHTRPGFSAKVLGSVALAVLQQSRRPVLVVWPPAQ
jgi:nucleotide-binding universal stress UspA family protein